jgi:hypothetical protein
MQTVPQIILDGLSMIGVFEDRNQAIEDASVIRWELCLAKTPSGLKYRALLACPNG